MRRSALGALLIVPVLVVAACGGSDDDEDGAGGGVELTWWHNATQEPLRSYFQDVADEYANQHPDVTFEIEPVQNESIMTKIQVGLQSNDPPDIFQQWGGGDLATQVESGKVQDITEATAETVEGLGGTAAGWQVEESQYGLPYSVGIVGFWYRTDLFEQAGIDAPPATMDELVDDIATLEEAGITPIALGGKDKWPDAFYWGYLATRMCSEEALQDATVSVSLDDECFDEASEQLEAFVELEPFQEGFLGTPAQQGAVSSAGLIANGEAAMELQGHWNPGVIASLTPDQKPLGDKLAWFPFPTVDGGEGAPDATFGGGDGFSCSVEAPPECADFLNFLISKEKQAEFGALNVGLPVAPETASSVSDPAMAGVLEARDSSSFTQLYFDKALPTAEGLALNDAIANFFAGAASADDIVQAVEGQ